LGETSWTLVIGALQGIAPDMNDDEIVKYRCNPLLKVKILQIIITCFYVDFYTLTLCVENFF